MFGVVVLIGAIYLFIVFKKRSEPGAGHNQPEQKVTMDDVAVVRLEFPQHFEDVKDLEGKSVWMKSGYSMPYYPYTGSRVEFTKPLGLLPPSQQLDVKKVIKASPPASVHDNVEHGDHQAMVVFTMPGSDKQYATAVGYLEGPQEEHYYNDLLFYYDDPHKIYNNWPKDVWAAVDAHQVKPGMNELQARTALGNMKTADGDKEGSRTVDYNIDGKHTIVEFRNDKAVSVQNQ
jgi:hypothetical protein